MRRSDVLRVPLFEYTLDCCGVAIKQGDRWVIHVGDAYYLRIELETGDHLVSQFAAQRVDNDAVRRASLEHLSGWLTTTEVISTTSATTTQANSQNDLTGVGRQHKYSLTIQRRGIVDLWRLFRKVLSCSPHRIVCHQQCFYRRSYWYVQSPH